MGNDDELDSKAFISLMGLYVGLQNLGFNQKQDSHHIPAILAQQTVLLNKIIQQNQEIIKLLKGDKDDSTRNL